MARGDGHNHGGGHRRDDTINDSRDFDGRPGSDTDSPQYDEAFNPLGQNETTNRPEALTVNRDREAQQLADQQAREDAITEASRSVKFFPSVGKFIIPRENTWAAHAALVKDPEQGLAFNPDKYVYFDRIIAEKFGNPALWDARNPDYPQFQGLRTNIAVMRNDTIGMYLNDGSFDPGDEKYIPLIAGVAGSLGDALGNDKWYKKPFAKSFPADVAKVEGVGAREMYKYLLTQQVQPSSVRDVATVVLKMPERTWQLPPIEETPYSDAGLSAPLIQRDICFSPQELANLRAAQTIETTTDVGKMAENAGVLIGTCHNLGEPGQHGPAGSASIDEARQSVRWLKNLNAADENMETFMEQGKLPEQSAKAHAIQRLIGIYAQQLQKAASKNPSVMKDFSVIDANDAAGMLALGVADHAYSLLPDDHPANQWLGPLLDTPPQSWLERENQAPSRLIDTLALGIERTSGAMVDDRPYADRLVDLSKRISVAAKQLRSVDTLAPPAREESIELAREILRRLKNMKFSDKTLEEFVTTGRPEEKAAFAQKLDDMVDSYKNLLSEAAQSNPSILTDARVVQANETVGTFSHAVKLMAAKEMPGSMAAAQQISADAALDPKEWKNLQDRTVGRLMQSMEGGLDKATGELQQQQAQEQAEEQAREAAIAQEAASTSRKKKRRRSSSSRSGAGGAKQRKEQREMSADDAVLKQGRFQQVKEAKAEKQANFMPGLKAEDLATIKALGGSLRGLNKEAKELKPMEQEKIRPDDKSFATRKKEEREGKKTNDIKI